VALPPDSSPLGLASGPSGPPDPRFAHRYLISKYASARALSQVIAAKTDIDNNRYRNHPRN